MDWYVIEGKGQKRTAAPLLRRLILAGGMSRVLGHLMNGQFAIVSAYRPEKSGEQNEADLSKFKKKIVEDGLGFYPADGFYVGLTEDSLFIPGASLDKALEYGRMFEPNQDSVFWGDKGEYEIRKTKDGALMFGGSVRDDFTILKDDEVRDLIQEKSDIGFTEIGRGGQRPWTTDPSIRDWRKQRELEQADELVEEKRACVISDPRRHMSMGNYRGIYKVEGIDGDYVVFDDKRLKRDSFDSLLAFIPM